MISVAGYKQLQLIHQGLHNLVYTGIRTKDKSKVILRQLRPELASPQLVSRHRKEFELLSVIKSDHVITPIELIETRDSPILVTEHPEGVPLIDFMDAGNISTQEAAKIGCLIARAIEDLHSYDIVHKDINPANIVYDRDSVSIKLIDFGISTSVSPNQIKAEVNRTLEGTLNYLSPEQTGRMNRSVDFRSDFYSLGVTLYQLLTGQLPFESEDSLELIYQHMTRQPMPLTSIKPDIPKALSKITLKLLSKMPEDRYQSAFAIIRDLDRVLDLMTENGHTDVDFEVALDDISEQLNISERLLERESQLIDLLNALDQTSSGESAAIFCIGENGIGKSSLVRELEREVISRGGYLGKGTYNPITTEVPYTAVSAAINDLVKQLLGQPDFPARKALIQKKLAGLEEPMFSLAPELRNIIEYVPSQKPVAPSEAKPKLVRGIIALLNTICDGKTPLVISLDNLQWIDSASIDLFEDLFSRNQLPYVMLVGAYRTFALDQSDPNRVRIQKLLDLNLNIQLLNLQPLSQEGVNRLVAESLFRSEDETNEFAKIIHEKTNGIPLAVKEFLNRIHEKEYLKFDRVHREWTWNMQSITSESPSDNVSLTLVHQLQNLDSTTIRLLQIASSIGIEFDLELLQMVSGLSFSETSTRLSVAIQQGYLLQLANQDGIRDKRIFFRFSNERIQQTVYEMIEQKDRRQIHASIGKAILQTTRGDVGNRIFDIVNQLNNSFEVPDKSGIDQRQLAELNITAGHRAKNAAAFQQAFKYFRTAIALLGQNAWVQYDRSLEIHLDAANVAYLCGDEHQLDLLINNILDHARTPTDTAKAVEIKVRSLIAATKLGDAIDTSLSALESLDIVLTKPARIKTAITAGEVLWRSWRLSTQEEIELPPMTDDRHLAAMKLLLILCQASYMAGDSRIGRYVLEMAHISLRHGLAPESSFVFPALGALFISRFGTIDFGYRLGRMAINNLRDDDKSLHCKTLLLAHNFNFSWKDHLYRTLEPLARAHQIGLENDDIEFALIAATTASANAFVLGHDLNSIQNSLIEHTTEAKHHQQTPIYYLGAIYLQACRNLTDSVNAPWLLEGESFSEDELLQHQELKVDDSALANLFVVKLYLATLFNRYEIAREFADQVRVHINAIEASPAIPVFYVFETLACIKTLSTQNFIGKLKLHLRIWRNRRKLRKWAHHAPENIQHRYHLIEAELAAYRGQQLQAMQHYELAINNAQKNRYLNDLALINELAGRFYLANNKKDLADYYINNAAKYFKRWGANNKVSLLQSQFSDLSNQTLGSQPTPVTGFLYGSDKSLLDLETVIKAS